MVVIGRSYWLSATYSGVAVVNITHNSSYNFGLVNRLDKVISHFIEIDNITVLTRLLSRSGGSVYKTQSVPTFFYFFGNDRHTAKIEISAHQ